MGQTFLPSGQKIRLLKYNSNETVDLDDTMVFNGTWRVGEEFANVLTGGVKKFFHIRPVWLGYSRITGRRSAYSVQILIVQHFTTISRMFWVSEAVVWLCSE